ncbi:serine hydrolase domain-containing protein [Acidobacteriota bacterium]
MKKGIFLFFAVVFVFGMCSLISEAGLKHPQQDPQIERFSQVQGPTDPGELESFLDGLFAAQMKARHIAGATIVVVKDGDIFFTKGYGYADVVNKKAVNPDETLFRIGSVSKLFTWTAVMQLYEHGLLDLDTDVNTYLKDFQIPDSFEEPITLKHLFSHTPGFEDVLGGMAARTPEDLTPLSVFIKEKLPKRIFSPGKYTAYSNYGAALAGYIVELVSSKPFEEYIEEFILWPLGMEKTTFRQPLPATLSDFMSMGYSYEDGNFKAGEFELINGMGPAGSMSSSAGDMAKFMIAHLQDGRYGRNSILKPDTVTQMQTQLFTHDTRVPGNAYGFWEQSLNNLRIIGHAGDTLAFHSLLALIPEKNIGFFVSYNSTTASGFTRDQLFQAFLDRYYPIQDSPEMKPLSEPSVRARKYVGSYGSLRGVFSSYEKLGNLMMTTKLTVAEDGTLVMPLPMGLGVKRWMEVSPLFFKEVNGQGTLFFIDDAKSRISHAYIPEFLMVMEKLKWHKTPFFHYSLLGFCIILFLSAALGWPLAAISQRLCSQGQIRNKFPVFPRMIAGLMSWFYLIFIFGMVGVLSNSIEMMFGVPPMLKTLSVLSMIAFFLTIGVFLSLFIVWGRRYWTVCGRIYYTLIFLASCVFVWFLNYWHLFGFKF